MSNESNLEWHQLKWRCRRGLLELDIVLQTFLENHYSTLTTDEKSLFTCLLELPDPTLMRWLIQNEPCEDQKLSAFIQKIKQLIG